MSTQTDLDLQSIFEQLRDDLKSESAKTRSEIEEDIRDLKEDIQNISKENKDIQKQVSEIKGAVDVLHPLSIAGLTILVATFGAMIGTAVKVILSD